MLCGRARDQALEALRKRPERIRECTPLPARRLEAGCRALLLTQLRCWAAVPVRNFRRVSFSPHRDDQRVPPLGAGLRFGVSRLRLPGGVSSEPCPGASFVSPADQPTERLCRAGELAASSSGWLRETECRGIPLAMPWGVACCAVRPTERQRRSSAQNGVARLHGARTARPVPD